MGGNPSHAARFIVSYRRMARRKAFRVALQEASPPNISGEVIFHLSLREDHPMWYQHGTTFRPAGPDSGHGAVCRDWPARNSRGTFARSSKTFNDNA